MKVIVFGATGQTGKFVVQQLLDKQHTVTAYVRNVSKLSITNPNLKVVENSMSNISALTEAIKNQDAVVSCLGSGSLKKTNTLETFGKQISTAMKKANVKKIVYMATAGIHKEIKGIAGIIVNIIILGNVINDHANAVHYFTNDEFLYTIVRPVQLNNGPLTGKYFTSTSGLPGRKAISRSNVAHFIVNAIETNNYLQKSVGLSE